ncbi:MAG: M16 family metallopeptidase, partial [Phycisphaerales bacterium]
MHPFQPFALVLSLSALAGSAHALPGQQTTPPPAAQPPAAPARAQNSPVLAGDTPLPSDPALVTGELKNGLRYIVRKHQTPPGHIAVWMHVSSGSMNETEAQRGLAHYLEHMAFNGSANFPAGSVVPFFESLGLKFGRDQNAFTSFDQTTYQLNMADAKPESLDKAMLFMSDVAFRLLLSEKEIESERQIIQNERTARSGAQQRAGEYMLERLSPESLVAKRLPIGTEHSIATVMKPDFLAYYTTRYVPSNITVLVVGDLEPEQAVKAITLNFGDAKAAPAPADQDPGVKPTDASRAIVFSDPELPAANVGLLRVLPPRPPVTTVAGFRTEILERIADFAFARRCTDLSTAGKAAFFNCGIGIENAFNASTQVSLRASGRPEQWKQILREAATELQRARLHGFTDQEVADACSELIAGAEQAVKRQGTVPARNLISRYNSAVAQGEPITSPTQRLELLRAILPGINAKEVGTHFARTFD